MSNNSPESQPSEEVDLGQLFKLIGRTFDRFFNFIGSIFKGLYHIFLLLLIHFYNRFKWYVATIIIGVVLGFILDKTSEKLYGANMYIETNFGSSQQVYENIKNLHELANKEKDSIKLSEILEIPVDLAAKLKGFYIMPNADNVEKMDLFTEFYEKLDSISKNEITFKDYIESLASREFRSHQIGVASTDKDIYSKLDKFVEVISRNAYLDNLLKTNIENLNKEDNTLKEQEDKIDSLVAQYLKIRVRESEKEPVPGSGTNLYMGNADQATILVDEAELIKEKIYIARERRRVNIDLIKNKNIVLVISNFPTTGYKILKWYEEIKYVMPIIFFVLTLLVFTFLGLGKYLKKQDRMLNEV